MIELAVEYQTIKAQLLAALPLSNDAVHVYLGLAFFLAAALLSGRGLAWWPALLPGLSLSVGMEVLDLVHMHGFGLPLGWGASFHDLLNTNGAAAMTFGAAWLWWRRSQSCPLVRQNVSQSPPEARTARSAISAPERCGGSNM